MAVRGSGLVRLAGLSGAAAVGLGAYGAHVLNVAKEGVTEEQRKAFEVANRLCILYRKNQNSGSRYRGLGLDDN